MICVLSCLAEDVNSFIHKQTIHHKMVNDDSPGREDSPSGTTPSFESIFSTSAIVKSTSREKASCQSARSTIKLKRSRARGSSKMPARVSAWNKAEASQRSVLSTKDSQPLCFAM